MNFQDPELEEMSIMTFGSFDFNSSCIGLFYDDDEETYIEIALEPAAPTIPTVVPGQLDDLQEAGGDIDQNTSSTTGDDIHEEEEMEFGISFSSSINPIEKGSHTFFGMTSLYLVQKIISGKR